MGLSIVNLRIFSIFGAILGFSLIFTGVCGAYSGSGNEDVEHELLGWETNTAKRIIELDELIDTGIGADDIAAVDEPVFITPKEAAQWLGPQEPVISVEINGVARAYPLQILIWHEIVNDNIKGTAVLVTYCPLCNAAAVFDRRVNGKVYQFSVSGFLRKSAMVMYDEQTETLWQQFDGMALVGDLVEYKLKRYPGQIISFAEFQNAYKAGEVLSRNTGYPATYGTNPYDGYDSLTNTSPGKFGKLNNPRLKPMERVVAIKIGNTDRAYPHMITRDMQVINDDVENVPLVIFHSDQGRSAIDNHEMANSRVVGSTGVFDRRVDGLTLSFVNHFGQFMDEQTSSTWDITGKAIAGEMKGKRLSALLHGDPLAFAYLEFYPEAFIYGLD